MLFNSLNFLVFLSIVFCLYWYVFNRSLKLQNFLLVVASYFFYGWWSWKFLGLLILSTVLDYLYGFWVASPDKKKARFFLWLSIINNLGILAIFKYYNFFALQFQTGLDLLGIHTHPLLLNIALPIGISFYTFHGMSYVFDIYRGKQKPVSHIIDYALFVSFFPLLVAGPIERAHHLLPQVQKTRVFRYQQAIEGCRLMLWGMFKKVVIADSLMIIVNRIFIDYPSHSAFTLIIGAVAFGFQIYGDFSGYSDIAIGTAKLFGFELLSNFRFPYFSRNIAEFWRRWHISLSSWFRDYLYIPLGGSKNGRLIAIRNTFIIFLVSGFWHGASWNFVIWGFIHASGFLYLLVLNKNRVYVSEVVAHERSFPSFKELRQMIATFAFVTLAWIFFRADKVDTAFAYISRIAADSWHAPQQYLHLPDGIEAFIYIIPLLLIDWTFRRNERQLLFFRNPYANLLSYCILTYFILYAYLSHVDIQSFIYFQF